MQRFFQMMSLFLALSIGVANASTANGLNALVQEYQYKLTVEWDQIDPEFADDAKNEFLSGLVELKRDGLSEQDLMNEIASHIRNPQVLKEMDQLRTSFEAGSMAAEDFSQKIYNIVKKDQLQGANWSGTPIVAGLALTLAIVWVVWTVNTCEREGCDFND